MRKVYKPEQFEKDEHGNLKIAGNTSLDKDGRWIVRADSRVIGYDIVFAGAGDRFDTMEIGGGVPFVFDFSDPNQLAESPPSGYQKIIVDSNFNDSVYMKEGTLFNYNAPKGSYIDFYLICPPGYYFDKKIFGSDVSEPNYVKATEESVAAHLIIKYFIEGTVPMGDELNTEACSDDPIPPYIIWRTEITTPETTGWQDFHGHWSFEIYRPSSWYYSN